MDQLNLPQLRKRRQNAFRDIINWHQTVMFYQYVYTCHDLHLKKPIQNDALRLMHSPRGQSYLGHMCRLASNLVEHKNTTSVSYIGDDHHKSKLCILRQLMIRNIPPAQVAEGQGIFGTSRSRMQQSIAACTRAETLTRTSVVLPPCGCCILLHLVLVPCLGCGLSSSPNMIYLSVQPSLATTCTSHEAMCPENYHYALSHSYCICQLFRCDPLLTFVSLHTPCLCSIQQDGQQHCTVYFFC